MAKRKASRKKSRKSPTRRRKRSGTRGTRGTKGLKGLKGFGQLHKKGPARDITPGMTGAVLPLLTTLGTRAYVDPVPGTAGETIYRQAPLIGAGVGLLGAGAMYLLGGGGPAASALLVSGVVSGGIYVSERQHLAKPNAIAALSAESSAPADAQAGTEGMRALVPEYNTAGLRGSQGTGAVMMEDVDGLRGKYGEDVQLQGTVDTGSFGTESFRG